MARARNLKPSFFTDDELGKLPPLARLLFAGLWCIADREGRLQDKPDKIKALVLPYCHSNVNQLLDKLNEARFIARYEHDGHRYIQVRQFAKHQNPHVKEPKSTIPAPDRAPDKPSSRTVPDREIPEPARLIPSLLIPSSLNRDVEVTPTEDARATADNGQGAKVKGAIEKIEKPKGANGQGAPPGQKWDNRPWVLATALNLGVTQRTGEQWSAFRDRVYAGVQAKLSAAKAKVKPEVP
jgi:hypothetical protein